jgi:hypothetical protein
LRRLLAAARRALKEARLARAKTSLLGKAVGAARHHLSKELLQAALAVANQASLAALREAMALLQAQPVTIIPGPVDGTNLQDGDMTAAGPPNPALALLPVENLANLAVVVLKEARP